MLAITPFHPSPLDYYYLTNRWCGDPRSEIAPNQCWVQPGYGGYDQPLCRCEGDKCNAANAFATAPIALSAVGLVGARSAGMTASWQ